MAKKTRKQLDKKGYRSQIGNHTGSTRTRGMHIITRKRLLDFGASHADALPQLLAWERIIERKAYRAPLEVKADFPSVDFVGPLRAVFNICRNDYRLVVDMRFDLSRVYIRHVVTHRDYDRLIAKGTL